MALKGKITKAERDALSDVLKAEYKPLLKDGQPVKDAAGLELFILDTPDMEHADDIKGLKSALEDERTQSTTRQTRITALEGEKGTLTTQLEDWKAKHPTIEAAKEALKKELIEKHQVDLDAANKKGETYRAALDKVTRIDVARQAIVAADGSADLLLPHVLDQLKFVENPDGTFKVSVINDKGSERIGDGQGNPMSVPQLISEMKQNEVFGLAFKASDAGGSGADNDTTTKTNGGNIITRAAFNQLDPVGQMAHVKAGGDVKD